MAFLRLVLRAALRAVSRWANALLSRLDGREPLCQPSADIALLHNLDERLWPYYQKINSQFWFAGEVSMASDLADWAKMRPGRRSYYEIILCFFLFADNKVIENIFENLLARIEKKEVKHFYAMQLAQESIHSHSYSIQAKCLLGDREIEIFNDVYNMPEMKAISDWIGAWALSYTITLGELLVIFAIIEGFMFQVHFMAIQLLKEDNIMPGLTKYNEFISRDEFLHCEFACFLLNNGYVDNPPSVEFIHKNLEKAVALVERLVAVSLARAARAEPDSTVASAVPQITPRSAAHYLRHYANTMCNLMQVRPVYSAEVAENPFPEADKIRMNPTGKSNFFHHRSTQYQTLDGGDLDIF